MTAATMLEIVANTRSGRALRAVTRPMIPVLFNSAVARNNPQTCPVCVDEWLYDGVRSGGFHRDKQSRTAAALARQAGRGDRGTGCRNHQGRAGTGAGRKPRVAPAHTRP